MDKCKDHNSFVETVKLVEKTVNKIYNDIYGETGDDMSIFERFRKVDTRFDIIESMIKKLDNKPKLFIVWLERAFKILISGAIIGIGLLKWAGKI